MAARRYSDGTFHTTAAGRIPSKYGRSQTEAPTQGHRFAKTVRDMAKGEDRSGDDRSPWHGRSCVDPVRDDDAWGGGDLAGNVSPGGDGAAGTAGGERACPAKCSFFQVRRENCSYP